MTTTEDHVIEVVPHDHVSCHTSRHWPPANGDCGTRFEARCSCGWMQGASNRALADAIAAGHRGYSPDASAIITADIPQGGAITDDQLRDLFARHCECRPLDLSRTEDDHAAIHDCDTAILLDVQIALGFVIVNGLSYERGMSEARARCTEYLTADLARQRGDRP